MKNLFYLLFTFLITHLLFGQEISWKELPADGKAMERHENALVAVGNKLILIGGRGAKPINIYDVAEKKWTTGAQPPFEIHHMQAVTLDGLVYVLGGFTGSYPYETPLSHILIYDVLEDVWTLGSEIPTNRKRGAAGVVAYNDKIYLVNGIINGHTSGWVPWFDEYDPYSNTWKQLPDSPQPRDHFQAAVINNKLYVAGGRKSGSGDSSFGGTVRETNAYNFQTEQWEVLPEIPTPRAGTAAVSYNDKYVIIGGESDSQEAAHNEVEAYDPSSKSWENFPPLLNGRHGTQAIPLENGIVIGAGSGNRGGGPELNSFEILSPEKDLEINLPPLQKGEIKTSTKILKFHGDSSSKQIELTNSGGNKAIFISYLQLDEPGSFEIIHPKNLFILAPGRSVKVEIKPIGSNKNATANLYVKSLGKSEPLQIKISK